MNNENSAVYSDSKILAINEDNLKTMILDIYEYRDRVSKILEEAQILVKAIKSFYNSEDGIEFINKFNDFSLNFPTFLNNIESYAEDLELVLDSYKTATTQTIDLFSFK